MKNEKFTIKMQTDNLKTDNLDKSFIDKAIDQVFEDIIIGNYNFFCVINNMNNNFMQTIFEDGQWNVEYSVENGIIYKLKTLTDPNELFYSFIFEKNITVEDWKKTNIQNI